MVARRSLDAGRALFPLDGRNVCLWIDITALKSAENVLREAAERLSHRVAELSRTQTQLEEINASRTDDLLAAQGELLKSERMAAIGQLTATVAHELRNPTAAIRNTIYLMKDQRRRGQQRPGIPAQHLAKVFEPLFTTKCMGTGLGLPTVKEIVEQHSGTIALESTIGEFTRAVIRLPVAASL